MNSTLASEGMCLMSLSGGMKKRMPEPGFISWQRATAFLALVKRIWVSLVFSNLNSFMVISYWWIYYTLSKNVKEGKCFYYRYLIM